MPVLKIFFENFKEIPKSKNQITNKFQTPNYKHVLQIRTDYLTDPRIQAEDRGLVPFVLNFEIVICYLFVI